MRVGLALEAMEHGDQAARRPTASWLDRAARVADVRDGTCGLHVEPTYYAEPPAFRAATRTVPSGWLAQLQRFAALLIVNPSHPPAPLTIGGKDTFSAIDSLLDRGVVTHLLCHATEGFFLPLDLARPVFDDGSPLPGGGGGGGVLSSLFGGGVGSSGAVSQRGGWIGSSAGLLDELVALSPALGVRFTSSAGRGALRGLRGGGGYDLTAATVHRLNRDLAYALRCGLVADEHQEVANPVAAGIATQMVASAMIRATEKVRFGASPQAVGGGLRGARILAQRRQRAEAGSAAERSSAGGVEMSAAAARAEAAATAATAEPDGFEVERAMWFLLFDAALLSIKHRSAVLLS